VVVVAGFALAAFGLDGVAAAVGFLVGMSSPELAVVACASKGAGNETGERGYTLMLPLNARVCALS
jgi:hypothetical protein